MPLQASHKTAAIAGAWAVLGLIPFEALMEHHRPSSVLSSNLLWLAAMAVFLFVPVYFLVIGRGNESFDRTWFLDRGERARYGVIVKRMFVWFVSAGAAGTLWSLVFNYLLFEGAKK